jgi:cell division protein FtsL
VESDREHSSEANQRTGTHPASSQAASLTVGQLLSIALNRFEPYQKAFVLVVAVMSGAIAVFSYFVSQTQLRQEISGLRCAILFQIKTELQPVRQDANYNKIDWRRTLAKQFADQSYPNYRAIIVSLQKEIDDLETKERAQDSDNYKALQSLVDNCKGLQK